MARALINVPKAVKRGEPFEIKALISHPMETGFRPDITGQRIARDILHTFVCTYNGEEIFRAELHPAMSANPFLSFFTVAQDSGELVFTWTGDDARLYVEKARVTVE